MKNINPIEKKIKKELRLIFIKDKSKLLADFFNGFIVEVEEKYIYDT